MAVAFYQGEPWWLSREEEQLLERENTKHVEMSVIRERVLQAMDLDLPEEKRISMSASQVLTCVGITHPTNPQAKECGQTLRQHFGAPKKINGIMKWRVPIDPNSVAPG
jgi:putative DNA primase/helicase